MSQISWDKAAFVFLGTTFLLVLVGLAILANSSIPLSQINFGTSFYYLIHQLTYGLAVGLVLFFIAYKIKPPFLKKMAIYGLAVSVVLLILVFIPHIGFGAGGARRWLHIFGISFQPSELAKLSLIVYLAYWLESKKDKVKSPNLIMPFMFWLMLVGGLILLEPDYGTFVIVSAVAFLMYFSAGAKTKTLLAIGLVVVVAMSVLILVEPYRRERVLSFLNPQRDVQGESYQQHQALIAIGSGGIFGLGLGKGVQKYSYLPETVGDSVFAIISEELGLLGASFILFIYFIWVLSGLKIASTSTNAFSRNVTLGVVVWIGLQAFWNALGILGLIPFAGIPLPFISYGGSALMIELAAVGLVANLARHKV